MTPEQVSQLSSAELNAACAEKIMGREERSNWYYKDGSIHIPVDEWSPATSLSDAAMCTEAMMAKGWIVEITMYTKIGCSCTIWRFSERSLKGLDLETAEMFDTREKQQDRIDVRASTEPRARAEAALLAAIKDSMPKL